MIFYLSFRSESKSSLGSRRDISWSPVFVRIFYFMWKMRSIFAWFMENACTVSMSLIMSNKKYILSCYFL